MKTEELLSHIDYTALKAYALWRENQKLCAKRLYLEAGCSRIGTSSAISALV